MATLSGEPKTVRVYSGREHTTKVTEDDAAAADSRGTPSHCKLPPTIPNNVDDQSDVIAIVGIGCRTPGADNIQDFWRVLKNGECHISDIPKDRWNADAFLDPDPNALGKAYVQKAGLIKDIEGFDNSLYGINDFEAAQMDPQQSLLLDCATMALQDAGITRQQLAGSNTGVFVGPVCLLSKGML